MVNPAHIREAEAIGVPDVKKTKVVCGCGLEVEELNKCGQCGHMGCFNCMKYDQRYAEYFCNDDCLVDYITDQMDKFAFKMIEHKNDRDYLLTMAKACIKLNDAEMIKGMLEGAVKWVENE